jgi:hypothetical protein
MYLKDRIKMLYHKYRKQDLYTRILLWAYRKQESGFTHQELVDDFNLTPSQDAWVWKMFNTSSDYDRKFFEHLRNDETAIPNQHYYALNEKGITSAVNYLSLKQAEMNSRLAMIISVASIILTLAALRVQIEGNRISEFASRGDRIQQVKMINDAISYCRENPNSEDSGLSSASTGRIATCKQTLETFSEYLKL